MLICKTFTSTNTDLVPTKTQHPFLESSWFLGRGNECEEKGNQTANEARISPQGESE